MQKITWLVLYRDNQPFTGQIDREGRFLRRLMPETLYAGMTRSTSRSQTARTCGS